MNPHEDSVWLSAYADSEVSAAERAAIEGHLKACQECRLELESLRADKRRLAGAPLRAMPLELIGSIEARLAARPSVLGRLRASLGGPRLWAPAGALAMAALAMSLWAQALSRDQDQYVPLEPLLAAHSRYSAESLMPDDNLVASNYSALTSYADIQDQDLD